MSFSINEIRKEISEKRNILDRAKGRLELLEQQLEAVELDEWKTQRYLENILKARAVAQNVAEQTQSKLEFHFSNLVSSALASVFKDPYEFILKYVQRRGKTECDFIFRKNENETSDILRTGGGGPADVTNFALVLAVWSVKKTRALIVLDEPFKYVSVDLQEKCSEMLKELSRRLGIQILMVSHLPNIIAAADNIIKVKLVNGISVIQAEAEE